MTDNEIIKALECCKECELHDDGFKDKTCPVWVIPYIVVSRIKNR